jgi:hypothetical protein
MTPARNPDAKGIKRVTLNFLIPGEDDVPLTPQESFVAGVNHTGLTGDSRQEVIGKLRRKESIHLIRLPDHPNDPHAVALFTQDGHDAAILTRVNTGLGLFGLHHAIREDKQVQAGRVKEKPRRVATRLLFWVSRMQTDGPTTFCPCRTHWLGHST